MEDLRKKTTARAGFTLVELVVVIAILGILAGVAYPAYTGYIKRAQDAKVMSQLSTVVVTVQSGMAIKGDANELKTIKIKITDYNDNTNGGTSTGTVAAYSDNGETETNVIDLGDTLAQLGDGSVFTGDSNITLKGLKNSSYNSKGTFTWTSTGQEWDFVPST